MPGGAGGELLALEQHHIGHAELGEVIRDAGADRTAADHDDLGALRDLGIGHGSSRELEKVDGMLAGGVGGVVSRPSRAQGCERVDPQEQRGDRDEPEPHGRQHDRPGAGHGGKRLSIFPGSGHRRELEALRSGVDKLDKSRKSVVIHGYGPVLGFENDKLVKSDYREISPGLSEKGISEYNFIHRLRGGPVFFVSGLSSGNVRLLQEEGYTVYYFSESAPSHCLHLYQYDPGAMGLTRLDVLNDRAFYRQHRRQ